MKIKSFKFSSEKQHWHIDEIFFDDLNLLVGVSGVGKTRILRALDLICDVAKDRIAKDRTQKLDDVEWTINFSHLGKNYMWELKTSNSINEAFSIEPGQAEILYEKITEIIDNNKTIILQRDKNESKWSHGDLPKLKRTESLITLLEEEDSIAPIAEAFKRFIFNEVPQRGLLTIRFDPRDLTLSSNSNSQAHKLIDIKKFKESSVDTPPVLKAYFLQQYFPEVFEEIKEYYYGIFPNIQDIRITVRKESINEYYLLFEIKENGVDNWISQQLMSSGMYRTLTFLVEILAAPNESVIVIDEFENSLGINCMPDLTEFILDKSSELQFILTSHHPYIINNIPWKTWQVVSRIDSRIRSTKARNIPELDTASSLDKFTQLIDFLADED